jgi:hypothetical protein
MTAKPRDRCEWTRQERVDKMTTKLPRTDNQVAACERVRRGRGERGIALISVISVLVLLAMIATPFLLTMTQSKERGDRFLYSGRADAEAQALFETVRSELIGGIESVERRRLDETGASALAAGQDPPADATPTYDTLAEMAMSPATLARFNRATAKEHRVWAADVVDTQTLFNLNNCSYGVLANILGSTEVAATTTSDKTSIPLLRVPESFPKQDGVVRISGECVKYKRVVGNELVDCERGYLSSVPGNGPAHDVELGEPVVLEACYQIATRQYRLRPGSWVRYTNIDQARTISDLGVTTLVPQDFERLRPFITAWNGNAVGDGWCNPQLVRNGITAGDNTNLYAKIKNIRYFGPGTLVRITDGVNDDYAIVSKTRGADEVLLAGNIRHDYPADQARIYGLARSPINVNTADVATLAIVFTGLHLHGKPGITDRQAEELAIFLKRWTRTVPPGTTPSVTPKPGLYRNWEDMTKALEDAVQDGKIDDAAYEAVLRNAMNANDSGLAFSTVPFVFRSFDTYEVRATVSIQGAGGREMARRELRRVMEVSSTKSGTFVVESQDDFQDQIMKSRDAKYMATYPDNVNANYDGKNIPASEYRAFRERANFPSTDRSGAIGDVQLLPGAHRMRDGSRRDTVQHWDDQRIPDGFEIDKSAYTISVDDPYDPVKGTLDLVDFVSIDGHAQDIELGLKEFSCSFWYRPEWERDNSEHIVFDYGLDNEHMNRVTLRFVPKYLDGGNALVLAVNGATREQRSAEVAYRFDHTTWMAKEWYHIACHAHGAAPGMLQLFVDGEKQGTQSYRTTLKNSVPAQGGGEGFTIEVDDARDFPQTGVLLVNGKDGIELMEYSRRTDDSFTIARRKARSVVHDIADTTPRSHVEGDNVQLYGFSGPLATDIKKGGATLDGAIGPWRAYRMIYEGDDLLRDADGSRVCRGLGTPPSGTAPATVTVPLAEWDTGSTDTSVLDDLGPAGTLGIAIIMSTNRVIITNTGYRCSPGSLQQAVQGQSQANTRLGGVDVVVYQVSQTVTGSVDILQRGLRLKHAQVDLYDTSLPRFFPSHEYGESAPDADPGLFTDANGIVGALTAFIPIAVIGQANNADYLDPYDKEPQLRSNLSVKNDRDGLLRDGHAYLQVDGEWFAYDAFDADISQQASALSSRVAFYRDQRLDELANQIGAFDSANLVMQTPASQPSTGQGGGSGGNSGDDPPSVATEYNVESNLPPDPTTGGATNTTQPALNGNAVTSVLLAQNLNFRGVINTGQQLQHRVANTIPAEHAAGVQILPTFLVVPGNCLETTLTQNDGAVFSYPGFNDLITLRDTKGNDEQVRVQWGYMGWCGLTAATAQSWLWDRPQGNDGAYAMRRWDSRAWTRALKFPCGEMPDGAVTKASQNIFFGKKHDNTGNTTPATIDELAFWQFRRAPKSRPNYTFLGVVPPEVGDPNVQQQQAQSGTPVNPPQFAGIDDKADEFNVHMPILDESGQVLLPFGIPVNPDTYASDGGVIQIDDELILFEEFDASNGKFTGCIRGAFNTEPAPHSYEARVIGVYAFPTTRLTSPIDTSTASYELDDTSDFPDDGYIRVGLSGEIIGYTNWDVRLLTAPLGRFEPTKDNTTRQAGSEEKKVAGSIFRGRFGTIPQAASAGEVAIAMPFRVYDRYAERADDPEQAYLQLSWTKHGGIWKRISWDEDPRKFINVIALVRFSGGPAWDADKIIHVGQEQMPSDDRRQYLYQIDDPTALNLLNVEADRIEVRIGMRFEAGAYDRLAPDIAPDSWKETPAIRKVTVEYVAPPQVLTQE